MPLRWRFGLSLSLLKATAPFVSLGLRNLTSLDVLRITQTRGDPTTSQAEPTIDVDKTAWRVASQHPEKRSLTANRAALADDILLWGKRGCGRGYRTSETL